MITSNSNNSGEAARFDEDVPHLAREAFELANRQCGACRNMHALWPYIRLARASNGIEIEGSRLEQLIAGLITSDRHKLLVAGAQDTSLFALGVRAGAAHDVNIAVLDCCDTPLEMCRRLADRSAFPVETVRQDLRDFKMRDRFDVILIHHTLQFVPASDRVDVLSRLARSLRPNGRLVHLFNVSRPISEKLAIEHRSNYADWVIEELDRIKVPLPEPRDAFHGRLTAHAKNRERHTGGFADPNEVDALMRAAKLTVESSTTIEPDLILPYRQFLSKLDLRSFVKIAGCD